MHLYQSKFSKIAWFVKRFGLKEVFLKPIRVAFAPMIIPTLPKRTFQFKGAGLSYFYHAYNMTWASERCIEVPIAMKYLAECAPDETLEVGNVTSHYSNARHEILDKFEKGPAIINRDIVGFSPNKKYSLILSISTFEHIGFDDDSGAADQSKIHEAIRSCRGLLKSGGKLVITVPTGYNPHLDDSIRSDSLGSDSQFFFERLTKLEWRECDKKTALSRRYTRPYPYANGLVVAEFHV